MIKEKMDFAKVLAILAQPKEKPAPLADVDRLLLEIPYITKEKAVETRPVRIVLPRSAEKPMPLIYVPHYEMGEDSLELRDYLSQGWAVACPAEFCDHYNACLTDDDLVFNNAALYALRHRPEFNRRRICLVGGSAGAYMAVMLSGMHLGLCATVANGVIANAYYNFEYYFNKAHKLNLHAAQASQSNGAPKPTGSLWEVKDLPIPFMALLYPVFAPVSDNFPDKTDAARWEALSPIGVADCIGSPVMMNHCTSDVLVPVDQISRRFSYEKPGESMPSDFDMRLPRNFPGRLSCTLEECLPPESVSIRRILVPDGAQATEDSALPFDVGRQFNINIYDDGPAEGYGTHSSRMDVGRRLDVPYLREMIVGTAARNCRLTPGMLKQMLLRCQGGSVALPAHIGVDDAVYGSLEMYRREVQEELSDWVALHGKEALGRVVKDMLDSADDATTIQQLTASLKALGIATTVS